MQVKEALSKINIKPKDGIQRAVTGVGDKINKAADPLAVANVVIKTLGGKEQQDFPTARIMAKSLVAQAVEKGDSFDPATASKEAEAKVGKLRTSDPYLFTETAKDAPKKRGRPSTNGGDLKAKALKICEENASLNAGERAQLIQKALKITYSNAYYYSTRVYKPAK